MDKFKKNERIGAILYILTNNPNSIFTYNYFVEKFNSSKTTISGDIVTVKELVDKLSIGYVETIAGAGGGVRFVYNVPSESSEEFLKKLCHRISDESRVIPGGFIFVMDILYSPDISSKIGTIFASKFADKNIEYVVTIETKGIPIALMTAKTLNVPLVIIRKDARITEGPTVSINYISGSTGKIQTMSLSRKSMKEGARVLIIDDFMKAGGTAKGIIDMMKEFKAEVEGIGVFMSTEEPKKKLVDEFESLLILKEINEQKGEIVLKTKKELTEE
ncbi:hypoxanthine DNA-binding transcriptional repressor PurR [Gottschalkia acidurici 9a]|uniref:Hypoxanthine DNA-binding transcriptional repressor PurR n=1 Tax=Gottschalkia acidurici (strain ATCC 7906 / DSM 604 / BCRC 14475 / CIP 104303 / KCTC 5404 / NCIMB 10678 / 9a) TaxID=1128398 RepID=K0B021_GOTA9|nr:pur operon repressor [Gottschalkia acidurici]AFS79383.1 hypoxanthine DNA-binding transcriptional repressor PurR [Gottschalkia acidurici 9a]